MARPALPAIASGRVASTPSSSPSAQRVQAALSAAGLEARIVELPQSARTAKDAALALGCDVERIAKSLVFRRNDNGDAVLVIASGTNRVDETLVERHVASPVTKADADFVRARTGFAIGGVPPLGHAASIRTLVDEDLLAFDCVWAAAGTPNAVFSVAPHDLVTAIRAEVVRIAQAGA